jgi:KTSC domain
MARASDSRGVDPSGVRVGAPHGSTSKPTPEELAILRNSEAGTYIARRTSRGGPNSYSMTQEQGVLAASLMDTSGVVSPLAGLPVAGSYGDFTYAKSVLGHAIGGGDWDEYWEEKQRGYNYDNLSVKPVTSGRDREPAPISLVPTSTTDPERPRTVAAGYDSKREVLTVVFRDGTFYNYYDVDPSTWDAFKSEQSKGQFIAYYLDAKPRGTANMKKTAIAAREQLYRISRTGQLAHKGKVDAQFDRSTASPVPRVSPVAPVTKIPGV